jgi:2'-5' RNA ligase
VARTFVAVWPSAEVSQTLAALPREHRRGVRWTHPEQWHITLRFLGEADPDEVAEALAGLDHPPVTARLSGPIGRLGRDVLVVPVDGLASLAAEVRARTATLGDRPPEDRAFLGHVTLARLRGAAACGLTNRVVTGEWEVREITVVTSRLDPDRARYTVVATVPLVG